MAYTTIDDPSAHFQATAYTGGGASTEVTNGGNSDLKPDFLWIKNRTAGYGHFVVDSNRNISYAQNSSNAPYLETESSAIENNNQNWMASVNTNGFTTGIAEHINNNSGSAYVAWQWKCNGGTTASNTDGDITSTVQVNSDAGFSIITYTGSGTTNETIGHGLGVEPDIAIFKRRDVATGNWDVQHNDGVPGAITTAFRNTLNLTDGTATNVLSSFSSTTIGLSTGGDAQKNVSGSKYVCYAFKAKQGYSRFGTYYGNGSTDGAYIHLGFKPALVIFKVLSDPNHGWSMIDNKRSPSNLMNDDLFANTAGAEVTDQNKIDFLSTGFKCRGSTYPANAGGTNTFSYFAWAENPFVTSTGVPATAR